jgi:hypothetical protein
LMLRNKKRPVRGVFCYPLAERASYASKPIELQEAPLRSEIPFKT